MAIYTLNDFFCGAGGMGLGFKKAGFSIAGAWDFDKWAVESYKNNVSKKVIQSDVQEIHWTDIPYADVWSFGFPCVDISTIGKMRGMIQGETRSGLFYEIMRLLDETKENSPSNLPKIILAENVKGLRNYLDIVEEEYQKHDYKMYYTLYNSNYWGVSQNRERYFVLGVHNSIEEEFHFSPQGTTTTPLEMAIEKNYDLEQSKLSDYAKSQILSKLGEREGFAYIYYNDRVYQSNEPSPTITTQCSVWTRSSGLVLIADRENIRKFTIREFANLQGFPKDYQFHGASGHIHKQIGNAVTINVSYAIALAISDFLKYIN